MIRYHMGKDESTDQILFRLPKDLIGKLESAQRRFGKRSRNQVGAEVIETYIDLWEELEQLRMDLLERQREVLLQQRIEIGNTNNVTPMPTHSPKNTETQQPAARGNKGGVSGRGKGHKNKDEESA